MSFTTRCPACGTTFKIVPDQLKISDGWVRCGHCADVFDATLFLEGEAAPVVPVAPVSPAMPEESEAERVSAPAIVSDELPEPEPAVVMPATALGAEDNEGDWLLHPSSPLPERAAVGADFDGGHDAVPKPESVEDSFADELRRFAQSGSVDKTDASPPESSASPVEDASAPIAADAATVDSDKPPVSPDSTPM